MAWTVAFALLGAIIFSIMIAPALASLFFPKGTREWHNPVMVWLTAGIPPRPSIRNPHALPYRFRGSRRRGSCALLFLSGVIGSEFLPHLDEGALWVRGTLAPSTGPTEGTRVSNQARIMLCSWPEVTQCTSQTGRPDDGTDTASFFEHRIFRRLKTQRAMAPGLSPKQGRTHRRHERGDFENSRRSLGLLATYRGQHGGSCQRCQGTARHQGLW